MYSWTKKQNRETRHLKEFARALRACGSSFNEVYLDLEIRTDKDTAFDVATEVFSENKEQIVIVNQNQK